MMLLRRSTIRKLPDPLTPARAAGGRASPLERNPQSPKGWKNRESDGIGLAIVAALGRSDGFGRPMPIADLGRARRPIRGGNSGGLFLASPPPIGEEFGGFRPAKFLESCHLCSKRLEGKDVYMYRGEKGFCSEECRYQQIVSDEFRERCGAKSLRAPAAPATSSCADDRRLFFTSIAAA